MVLFVVSAQFDTFSSSVCLGVFSSVELAKEAIEIMVKRSQKEDLGEYASFTEDDYRDCFEISELPDINNLQNFEQGEIIL
jgi:hypothetical protein